jgi:hypothetical protein
MEIISIEIWNQSEKVKQIQKNNPKQLSTSFLLKDKLCCLECSEQMNNKNNGHGNGRVYYCNKNPIHRINATQLEEKVIECVGQLLTDILKTEGDFQNFYQIYISHINKIKNNTKLELK